MMKSHILKEKGRRATLNNRRKGRTIERGRQERESEVEGGIRKQEQEAGRGVPPVPSTTVAGGDPH